MAELKIVNGAPTIAYAYLARRDFQAPDTSRQELEFDGVDVIAKAKPIDIQTGATSTVPPSSACNAAPGVATIILSVVGTTASGQVSGLDPNQYPACKVLVYLETDKFYIQPILGGSALFKRTGPGRWPNSRLSMAHQL